MPSLRRTQKKYSFFSFHEIMLFRLLLGFYFKCSNSTTICLILKLYCIGCCGISYLQLYLSVEDYSISAAVFFYDALVVIEITVNVLISLITEEENVMKFSSNLVSDSSSTLQNKVHCRVTNSLLFIAIIGELICYFLSLEAISFAIAAVFYFKFCALCSGRMTAVYIVENYQETVKFLCKALKCNFEIMNLSAAQKNEHVANFCKGYMKLSKNLDATRKFLKLQVF